jgi:hypothetical protein
MNINRSIQTAFILQDVFFVAVNSYIVAVAKEKTRPYCCVFRTDTELAHGHVEIQKYWSAPVGNFQRPFRGKKFKGMIKYNPQYSQELGWRQAIGCSCENP